MHVCVHVGPHRVVQTALTSRLGVVSMHGPRFHLIRSQLRGEVASLYSNLYLYGIHYPLVCLLSCCLKVLIAHPGGLNLEAHGSQGGGCTVLWVVVYCKW